MPGLFLFLAELKSARLLRLVPPAAVLPPLCFFLLPLELDGRRPVERQFQSILRLLGMEEKEFYYPNQLSGGQQQRVAIARALMTEPKILLADEPTGNLDSKNSAEIISLLRESNRRLNQTILLVTHDSRIAEQADRILEISDGKIIRDTAQA